jgi:hypothetical protein
LVTVCSCGTVLFSYITVSAPDTGNRLSATTTGPYTRRCRGSIDTRRE